MSYNMKTKLANPRNYGNKRSLSDIKYIVIHYTANDGDSDEGNGNYFSNNVVGASAHYFVDDDSVTQSVPDDNVAWSVGGKKYSDCSTTGGGKLYGVATNNNTLNIEMCDAKRDGKIMVTEETLNNTVELCKTIMKKYNIDTNHVIRHFDVNGKHCPAYMMDETSWNDFKNKLNSNAIVTEFKPYKVKVDIDNLNIRKGPGTNNAKTGKFTGKGVFTIIEESKGSGSSKGWGRLKSGEGWISLDFVTKM